MGYELKIGQAVRRFDSELGRERVDCEKVYLSDAPAFGEVTDHTNVRMPSYSTWEVSAREVTLYKFFYDEDMGLWNGPDGFCLLTLEHKATIDSAFAIYLEPGPSILTAKADADWTAEDFHFERLRWLKFWVDWGLENCDEPVFINCQ